MIYTAPGDALVRLHTAAEALEGAAAHGTFAPGDAKAAAGLVAVAELAAADLVRLAEQIVWAKLWAIPDASRRLVLSMHRQIFERNDYAM